MRLRVRFGGRSCCFFLFLCSQESDEYRVLVVPGNYEWNVKLYDRLGIMTTDRKK